MIRDLALLLGILLIHALALIWLAEATRLRTAESVAQSVMRVEFVSRPKPPPAGSPLLPASEQGSASARPTAHVHIAELRANPARTPASEQAETFRAFDSEGRVWIPQQALDEFLGGGENKTFEVGRAAEDDLRKLLYRPPVLDYRSTRFDDAWQGDKPPLTRVLEAAVEKSTATIKIPVPGRPGAFLQCKIMVLAASGGCGFTANDDGYYVLPDDPNTLSPEEDKQCQAWWDLIVSAKTQGEWRRTRTLYDRECRKPLLQAQ